MSAGKFRSRIFATAMQALSAVALAGPIAVGIGSPAVSASAFQQGQAAYRREDYVYAAKIFIPLAAAGQALPQAYLGYMFENGRGVPQNYTEAAFWYRRSAEQGATNAQYSLGLLYDKGFGVTQDPVEACKWLTLAAASAPKETRDMYTRLRDAVTTKLTRGQIAEARYRALVWVPTLERQR